MRTHRHLSMKKAILSLLALTPFFCSGVSAQTPVTDADLTGAYQKKNIARQGNLCHDPSIIIDNITNPSNPTYYIYGSHLGHGYTTADKNYQQWSTWAAGEGSTGTSNSLFCNTSGTLVNYANAYNTHAITKVKDCKGNEVTFGPFNAHSWQYTGYSIRGNQWAADAIYNKTMKKWCMYMSINGDRWASVIVCLTSDNIKGPWKYQGPVVFSGFQGTYNHVGYGAADDWKKTDFAIATGETSLPSRYKVADKWGTYWPNCIDPAVFYDDNGDLMMSYGSWSGGIFMIKLDPNTGLRDYTHKYPYQVNGTTTTPGSANANCTSDPYFGKKIAGGYYVSGEASYIEKIGKYWYLFMSYGGLDTKGGYQMRIFRSQKADGPYVDPYGTSAIFKSYVMNYGSSAKDARGMLLMGGYKWEFMPYAEIAQGHNSAFTDHKGRSFVVYHTRSTVGHEGHEVRVHQLFLNQDGWIMAAPYEFSGETITNDDIASKASIPDAEIPGNYQFMRHEYNQNTAGLAYETPVDIELTADGKIKGGATGIWTRTAGTDFINLTISSVVYKGVLVRQTIDYTNIPALCISACSSSSGSLSIGQKSFTYQQNIWCSKANYKAAIKYTLDNTAVPFSNGATIRTKPTLPTTGRLGAKVTWKSSNENIMTSDGIIKGKGSVVMTMSVEKDGYAYSKAYSLTVDAGATPTTPVYYPSCGPKAMNNGWWTEFSEYYTINKGESAQFKFINHNLGSGDNWFNWLIVTANNMRGASNYKEYFVLRNDNYGWDPVGNTGQNTMSKPFSLSSNFNWDTFMADMNGASVDMTVSYTTAGHITMNAIIKSTSGKTFPYNFGYNAGSSDAAITVFFTTEKAYIEPAATAVRQITESVKDDEGEAVNLAGQKVGPAYKGIIIRNGKKFYRR